MAHRVSKISISFNIKIILKIKTLLSNRKINLLYKKENNFGIHLLGIINLSICKIILNFFFFYVKICVAYF